MTTHTSLEFTPFQSLNDDSITRLDSNDATTTEGMRASPWKEFAMRQSKKYAELNCPRDAVKTTIWGISHSPYGDSAILFSHLPTNTIFYQLAVERKTTLVINPSEAASEAAIELANEVYKSYTGESGEQVDTCMGGIGKLT